MADPNTQSELNRLYWEAELSVSDIADRLDISRRALYDGIEPRPAGEPCPECGAELGYRNRTALENGEAECPECGFDTELAPAGRADDTQAAQRPPPDQATGPLPPPRALPAAGSGPILGAAFVAGMTIGAMVTHLLHRR